MDTQNNDPMEDQFNVLMKSSNSNLGLFNGTAAAVTTTTTSTSSGSDNNSTHSSHQFVSTNSFELNAATSLSEDSGLPHTNSSISSGDSIRVELCKFEFELAESDGEVSQFDSLDNCSDGGMSAENFNTLKKGPLAPIDPPPEFQDSPQTTLIRSPALQSFALKLTKNLLSSAMKLYSACNNGTNTVIVTGRTTKKQEQSQTPPPPPPEEFLNCYKTVFNPQYNSGGGSNFRSYELYASDSLLNRHTISDNIYDIPNGDIDYIPKIEHIAKNRIKPHHLNLKMERQSTKRLTLSRACEIYDYDIYYNNKKSNQVDSNSGGNQQKRKTPVLYSPLHYHPGSNLSTGNRPNSRNSLNSRLSSSHNSLTVPTTNKADDSIFITQAMSHDALTGREISDFYNVPMDSDIYALPIDVISSTVDDRQLQQQQQDDNKAITSYKNLRGKLKYVRNNKKRRKPGGGAGAAGNSSGDQLAAIDKYGNKLKLSKSDKRHSVPENTIEPMHMTLDEVKRFYHSLYSSSSDSSDAVVKKCSIHNKKNAAIKIDKNNHFNNNLNINNNNNNVKTTTTTTGSTTTTTTNNKTKLANKKQNSTTTVVNVVASTKDECANNNNNNNNNNNKYGTTTTPTAAAKKSQFSINLNLKQKFCSIFRFRKSSNHHHRQEHQQQQQMPISNDFNEYGGINRLTSEISCTDLLIQNDKSSEKKVKFSTRALPPLPGVKGDVPGVPASESTAILVDSEKKLEETMDFAANIEKVKEYGWYWGPISSEAAEKILSNEPDGSFIVRDSSDDHYIFSLSFKLNNSVRHVRIEQDQGTFSFGSCAKFKSHTIMEFIENAVESSRSGRYVFFFHRRPEHGPMRVQLTNPVSRFKHIQSLQHMCRFVIRKTVVRKDLIQELPLPRRLLDYLSYKNCYSEQVESDSSQSQMSDDGGNSSGGEQQREQHVIAADDDAS